MAIDFIPDDGELYGFSCSGMSGPVRSKIASIKQRFKQRATKAIKRHVNNPRTKKHVRSIVRQAKMSGVDFENPEMMGTWLKDIGNKFKAAINKTKSLQLTTDRGTAQLGPKGITWTDQQQQAENAPGDVQQASSSGLADMLKNPMVIGAGISLAALLLSKRKGRKK
jgi:hypothetical protein